MPHPRRSILGNALKGGGRMIRELSIRNLAVIEAVDLSFDRGMHVLTGETGAGKSILIDAIALVLGARGSAGFVRHQEKKAEITALFEPDEHSLVWQKMDDFGLGAGGDERSLLIKRDISHSGKSTCRINGEIVTLTMLRQIGATLIDIHGQHDHQSLLREEEHITWLDAYAGKSIQELKRQYRAIYDEYREVVNEIRRLKENEREMAQRIDLLEFQQQEIAAAQLEPNEDDRLQKKRKKLAHMEKLVQYVQSAYIALQSDNQAMNDVGHAMTQIELASEFDPDLTEALEMIKNAYYQLEEAASALGRIAEGQEFDPQELNDIEARLFLIDELKRKYAPTVNQIIEYSENIGQELNVLKNRETHTSELQRRQDELLRELFVKAEKLTITRRKAAKRLQQDVERELHDLNMKHTKFHVVFHTPVDKADRRFSPSGWDELTFVISANPGEPPKPLAKIASGGELSRIMLALKTIFHNIDDVGSLIFDEIDAGVSGRAAQAIAEKMYGISQKRQVLCVTHLPQVASMADHHIYIAKQMQADDTQTHAYVLSGEERVHEMTRMLGGVEVTNKTRQHAEEMLRLAEESKKSFH